MIKYSIEKIEKALIEYFSANIEKLKGEVIKTVDIGVFPWNSKVEISFYVVNDSAEFDDIAAWIYYDVSNMFEGGWESGKEVGEDLNKEWNCDKDILPFLFDMSSAVTAKSIRDILARYNIDNDFFVQILNPDNSDSKNYCEW